LFFQQSKFRHSLRNKLQLLGDFVPKMLQRGFALGPHWEIQTLCSLLRILNMPLVIHLLQYKRGLKPLKVKKCN